MYKVMFICRGNYFRSRFAEILFNKLAARERLPVKAFSRGLNFSGNNAGPVSLYVPIALMSRGIEPPRRFRNPLRVQERDLKRVHVAVITHGAQQLPIIEEKYPGYLGKLICWDVPDVTFTREDFVKAADDAEQLLRYEAEALAVLAKIESHVADLVARMKVVLEHQNGNLGTELVELLSAQAA